MSPPTKRLAKANPLRDLAAAVLDEVRKVRWIHAPVHLIAVQLAKTQLGARMIKAVISPQYPTPQSYSAWVADHDTLTPQDRRDIQAHIDQMSYRPLISVVMPAYNTEPRFLEEAIQSVRDQLYPYWELCIADDASPKPEVWALLQAAAAKDKRIKVMRRETNGHISAASNSALTLATGEFVALMDHDDLLPAHALYEVAAELQDHPDADLIYSDEDKVDENGVRFEAYFKTGWNPELMLSQNMVSHLGVYRRALIEQVGGFRESVEGSQDYDLVLRVAEATQPARIRHIPAILYHWRQQSGPGSFSETNLEACGAAALIAVREHLQRTGQTLAVAERRPDAPAWLSIVRTPPVPRPLVSVLIPTRDKADLLAKCLSGVLNHTTYDNLEVLIIDNDSVAPETKALFTSLSGDSRVRIIPAPGPFNYSAINNRAVAEARGEILLLLNNDIVVQEPDWLDHMVAQAVRPEVGAVGARLLYADGRVQHGGVILGVGGQPPVAGNLYAGASAEDNGYYNHLRLARNLSAVTAACLAMRKSVFEEIGGFDAEHLAVAFNDVDLCLKIREAGYQIIWTPLAELVHLESASRGSDSAPANIDRFAGEVAYMRKRWGEVLDRDPYYGPNFDRLSGDYRLAFPPLRVRPWKRAK